MIGQHRQWPKEYAAWRNMLTRCFNRKATKFRYYGGRGITVCARWKDSFVAFLGDVGPSPSARHSIDRHPNNDGDYEPGNVRWATPREQQTNKRPPARRVVRGVPVGADLLILGRAVLARLGDKEAAKEMGIGRATLSRVLAELPVAPGTFALLREYQAKVAS